MPSLTADAQQKLDCDPESWGCCWSEQASAGSASGSTSVLFCRCWVSKSNCLDCTKNLA